MAGVQIFEWSRPVTELRHVALYEARLVLIEAFILRCSFWSV